MTAEPVTIVRSDRDRVAVLLMDYPGRTMNIIDERLLHDLRTHVDRILTDASVDAIVLGSAKAAFGAGADMAWLPTLVARPDAEEFLAKVHRLMLELAGSPKPVVGIGFPRSLGGPFHWADEQGAAAIVKRCRALGVSAFPPGTGLERLAAEGGRFAHARRRMAPFTDAAEQA